MDTKLYGNACGRAGALWVPEGEAPAAGGGPDPGPWVDGPGIAPGPAPVVPGEAGPPVGEDGRGGPCRGPGTSGRDPAGPERMSGPWSEAGRLRRYRQLRHAEERLRPLRETRLAHVYWTVHDEMRRLGREIRRAMEEGGSPGRP